MHIEKRGNSLLIRFSHEGKPYSFSLPKHNNPVGISNAKLKIAQIEKDIAYGNFDTSLLRYKPRKLGKNPTAITAVELVQKYIAHRRDSLSNGSIVRLQAMASKLTQLLGDKPAEKVTESVAKDAIARWSESASTQSIKTYLFLLKACWEWAKGKYHIAETNPWSECLDRVRSSGNNGQSKQLKPFTIAELQAIIAAFRAHPKYCHYTDFVVFLSHSACRLGEVAGLRWKHIGADFATAWIGESISRGHQNKKGTKTGKTRTIQLSPTVTSMLADRRARLNPQPEDLVFPSPLGLAIDDHRFRARAWKTILENCRIEYRSPYKIRHSAISHALNNGANFIALAEQTGHDKRVMLSTYAHAIDRECLFVDF
ncbi:tyrosine-type recombinase/integrase [Chamaesiphon minutus]|uniref:Site-specific recombinase XerC n=1 Tax=Chamaesiphon minutus (strain ATCC 27169 / PCC 6605) TaxID=1173020 RepID=K9UKW8_CHAP6|nr:tyrosine-type recombinase/integrase [Chamaesiphon minutus]AFY95475.1 site-specific recombinase XerC [Chamaesiphon minutus PCC 6605]